MINLMPDDYKKELRAARSNVRLTRYMLIVAMSGAFLAFIIWGAQMLMTKTSDSAQQLIEANDSKSDIYNSTKAQVDTLSAGLTEGKSILDGEISFSTVFMNIAQQMPPNTIIDKISLDSNSFNGTPITVTIYAKANADAIALRDRFQSSTFFTGVNFQTVTDNNGITGYPVSATLTMTLARSITQ